MIRVSGLQKAFETLKAVDAISFEVQKGELCGVLGPNGAGKSTLFKMLMGLLESDAGAFSIAGEQIVYGETAYKNSIGYAPEAPVFFEYLTGWQFLAFIAAARGIPKTKRADAIARWLHFFDLDAKANELIAHYSQGMRRKLSLSAALLGEPELLILDEATNGLDPESSYRIKSYFRDFCANGGTILFSTHIIEIVEHLCDRIIILHDGKKLAEVQRAAWQAWRNDGSSLEREFVRLIDEQKQREA